MKIHNNKIAIGIMAMLISNYASAQVSDQQIKDFFASNPTPAQIAAAAASLGMNESQISAAMGVANYGGTQAARDKAINEWVANQNNGYSWNSNGTLVQNGASSAGIQAAEAAAKAGQAAYGKAATWANGQNRVCPAGMTVGINKAGSPKCIGAMTREFPTGEAQINTVAVAQGGQQVFANASVSAPAGIQGNISSQDYTPRSVGLVDGNNSDGGSGYMPTGVLTTQGGQRITHDQLMMFAATNPTDAQILAQASAWGMSELDVNTALHNVGQIGIYNRLSDELWRGTLGYGAAAGAQGADYSTARIVPGNGYKWVPNPPGTGNGDGQWVQFGTAGNPPPLKGSEGAAAAEMAARGGSGYMPSGVLTTQGGQKISHDMLMAFMNANPTDALILEQASAWGMSELDLNTALHNVGQIGIFNRLSDKLWRGTLGYGAAAGAQGADYSTARIVPGTGHKWVPNPPGTGNGDGQWVPFGPTAP